MCLHIKIDIGILIKNIFNLLINHLIEVNKVASEDGKVLVSCSYSAALCR